MNNLEDIEDVIEDYKKSEMEKGFSEKLKNRNKKIVKENEKISDLRIQKSGEETYVLNGKEKFECIVKMGEKPKNIILEFFLEDEKKLEIYSKNIKEGNGLYVAKIDVGPLYLDESRYKISINTENGKLIDNIKISVKDGDKKFGDHILIRDPSNNKKFPYGKFYGFGKVNKIIQEYENGKSVYVYTDYIDTQRIKEEFDEAKIINEK